jgi:hypothetical protein
LDAAQPVGERRKHGDSSESLSRKMSHRGRREHRSMIFSVFSASSVAY